MITITRKYEVWSGEHITAFQEYLNMYSIKAVKDGEHNSRFVTKEEAQDIWIMQEGESIMVSCDEALRGNQVRAIPKRNYENGMSAWRAIGARLIALAAQGGEELYPNADECRVRAERLLQHVGHWHERSQLFHYDELLDKVRDGYAYDEVR
jgi:hypothetical protein